MMGWYKKELGEMAIREIDRALEIAEDENLNIWDLEMTTRIFNAVKSLGCGKIYKPKSYYRTSWQWRGDTTYTYKITINDEIDTFRITEVNISHRRKKPKKKSREYIGWDDVTPSTWMRKKQNRLEHNIRDLSKLANLYSSIFNLAI